LVITLPLATPPVTPTTPSSFQEKDIGSSLEVEANIAEDNFTVDLNLAMAFTEFDGFINYGSPILSDGVVLTENRIIQPVFSKVATTAQVQIYDGQTVAVGGLTEAKMGTIEDKVPILGSIPIIGKFFKSHVQQSTRTAVIYFVTVKIVDPAGENVHGRTVEDSAASAVEPPAADSFVLPDLGK
jgi:general secretion pathway protein D